MILQILFTSELFPALITMLKLYYVRLLIVGTWALELLVILCSNIYLEFVLVISSQMSASALYIYLTILFFHFKYTLCTIIWLVIRIKDIKESSNQ